ncbi:kinase domain protein (macronuclear) [Tetrahymena thermophila SB210]|uniref:Kinase domain protein n=1 Tax=Tetrahymena thermophila (strain SB210) TaxID=312017 RepID=W7XD82_TETTS|nr:kinase domain protein [Tetrahymena thermophila SB210]EWS74583.1 kinase domain protein [Tetrahymena thermophila SB210]|eukprot:XP_012652884.1 kinase domain protein [Tetrahymena thermophila SB210]
MQALKFKEFMASTDLSTIDKLIFDFNNLSKQQVKLIPQFFKKIAQCNNLKYLFLDNIHGPEVPELIEFSNYIATCQSIEELFLDFCYKNIDDLTLPDILKFLPSLKCLKFFEIYLQNNNITANGIQLLGNLIIECKYIEQLCLQLGSNQIGNEGLFSICNEFQYLNNLTNLTLYAYNNQINDEGISGAGFGLFKCKNLKYLDIDFTLNDITDKGALELVKYISKFNSLAFLKIYMMDCNIKFPKNLIKVLKKTKLLARLVALFISDKNVI